MKIFFELPQFDAQLLRALSYTYYGGADIGECITTASKIKEDDFDTWYDQWFATAESIRQIAESSYDEGHHVSAREAFFRASNYYRTAIFFLYGAPVDPRLIESYQKHTETFSRAVELLPKHTEAVRIPYEETTLPGYFYKAQTRKKRVSTIIVNGGYDSTHQENYFAIAQAALQRGYNVLCFDGPGQGEALIEQNLYMRHDWENVISSVVDYLTSRPDVDKKRISLLGQSWGGFLATRAAAFETRISALIAHPGQFDAMENIKQNFPEITELLQKDENNILEKFLTNALTNKIWASKFKAKMWVHGVESPVDLLKTWTQYSLADVAQNIACPTLVCDSENEQYSKGQAKELYDALTCPKEYILFTNADGAGETCQAGAISLFHQKAFDWLDEIMDNHEKLVKHPELTKKYKAVHTI